jgi:ribosomal-protein-alanine N-acetyltransferase
MLYQYKPMEEEYANEIIHNWHYSDIYAFYDMTADKGDLKIFTDRSYWKDTIFSVLNENDELIGWSSFYLENGIVWLSLGLKPELTGTGLGEEFILDCIRFAKSHYQLKKQAIKLDVALFNRRAIKVYKRAGFIETNRIIKNTQIGKVEFLRMTKTLTS